MDSNPVNQTDFLLSEEITRDYHIVSLLGRGGMGDVYLAEQLRVGRRLIALKVLNRAYAENPQIIKRFEAEAATAGLIHHRNVVTIYESRMTTEGHIYVAMEYVNGRTLREVMVEQGRMPVKDVIEIAKQVCAGLAAAHKLGIVHRDIKPDNIMLVRDDEGITVKVLDFGIARLSETQAMSLHTKPGSVLGTPAYMSPEQAAGAIGDQIDSRSDIYSLGMVVYEMLTGRVAFAHQSWIQVLHQHLYDPPPSLSQICEGGWISPSIDQAVMRTLAKDRNKRPQNVTEFARELEDAYRRTYPDESLTGGDLESGESGQKRPQSAGATSDLPPGADTERELPQTTPIPRRETEPPRDYSTVSIKKASNSSKVLAGVGALLVLICAGWLLWPKQEQDPEVKNPSTSPTVTITAPSPIQATPAVWKPLFEYRIRRNKPVANLLTLPLDQTVQSDERIWFEFNLKQQAAIYLFQEEESGSWIWIDPPTDDRPSIKKAGNWISIPRDHFCVIGEKTGEEKFWVIYVPPQVNWSLNDAVAPARISLNEQKGNGTAEIEPDAATRLLARLNQDGVRLEAEGKQSGKIVTFLMRQPGEASKVAFYQIKLNHIARE
jgi:serine/threonine-protein kinase